MHPLQSLRARLRRSAGAVRLGHAGRGRDSHIVAGAGTTMLDARCESCGACVGLLPHRRPGQQNVRRRWRKPDKSSPPPAAIAALAAASICTSRTSAFIRVASNPHAAVNAHGAVRQGPLRLRLRAPPGSPDETARARVSARWRAAAQRSRPLGGHRLEHSAEPGRGKA